MFILDLLYFIIIAAFAYVFIGVPVLKFIGILFVITMIIYGIIILKSPEKKSEDEDVIHIKTTLTFNDSPDDSDDDSDEWHL